MKPVSDLLGVNPIDKPYRDICDKISSGVHMLTWTHTMIKVHFSAVMRVKTAVQNRLAEVVPEKGA